ncbi:MAG: hypothetical protein ACLF0P_10445 [Thermoanaerobaculia bacterium]
MPFQYILANLLANVEGAVGVLFLDDSGETVDLSCSEYTPYQMRVLGAYLGIYMRQLEKILEGNRLGAPRSIHIEKDALHVYAAPLPDGYYLVLVQRQPAVAAAAQRALETAADELEEHLFAA